MQISHAAQANESSSETAHAVRALFRAVTHPSNPAAAHRTLSKNQMQPRPTPPVIAAALAGIAITLTPLMAQIVFSESFEAPVVTGFASNTVPSGGNWIGATNGFGATNRGLYNEAVVWPDTPKFSTPFGAQAYFLNYTNSALTTAVGATGQSVTADVPYSVTFNTAVPDGVASGSSLIELVAFGPADDNVVRRNGQSPRPGTVLASASGPVTGSDMSVVGSLTFTATADNAHLGKDLAIRIVKANNVVLYDNVRLILGHDLAPVPASGFTMPAGDVSLSWTNMPPNAPATDVYVDVFFGTDPGNLPLVVDGEMNTSTTNVNAAGAGTYYWRIDSYLDGDPNGTAVTGDVFFFTVTDSDGDGIPDWWEIQHFGSATGADANADPDNDGLTNLEEYIRGTNPNNPDTDGDGLLDGVETATGIWVSASDTGTHPLNPDSDGDGLLDGVETNTGVWVNASDTGTDPHNPDTDGDGLLDGWETNTGIFVSRFNTGTDPHDRDTDGDGVWDYYEVAAAFTDPNDPNDTPTIPYPLPAPDPNNFGASDKPVKVYILSGQSNMLGFGKVSGIGDGTLNSITRRFNRFPNLLGPGGEFLARQDVKFRESYSGTAKGPLAPGFGKDSDSIGPELGFGHIMGWYHDEPVLLIKASWGNRGLGWDILPPGNSSYTYLGTKDRVTAEYTYAGYGESPDLREIGTPSTYNPGGWYAGYEWDRFFMDESEWAHPGDPVTNVVDVLDNFATEYPEWAGQGFEVAGFVWWQGDRDRGQIGHAEKYEENLVSLIDTLRNYYSNRYPGQVVPNAPFVLATLGQTAQGATTPASDVAIFNAQMAVDGDSGKYPEFAGNVKTVYAHPLSQGGASNSHYNLNAETYLLVGDALGVAMLEMQDDTSPPSPNPLTFAVDPTAVDATTIGMVATTAFDTSGPVEYLFENLTTAETSGWITATRWDNTGLAAGSYDYRVKARDALGNEGDWSATVSASPGGDVTAPSPDPMSFEVLPSALGEVSIGMTATTASDINGVEYYFECTVGGGPNSGWQPGTQFTAVGLNPGTEYTYVVRARDSALNVTGDSAPASATTLAPDTTPPSPDPMTFASPPAAIGISAITMTATTATDESGVEYFFEAVGGGTSSGWQDSPSYTDGDLAPGTEYGYRVRARDKSPAQNTTGWSDVLTATTEVPDTTPPSPDPMTFASPPAATGPNSISMTATAASDPNGVEYLFANVTLGTESGWQTSPVFTSTGLEPETEYVYQVKARDLSENLNETAFSAPAAATTTAAPSGPGGAVIYEPFDDADATLAGNTPGFGLTGTWSAGSGTSVVAGSLAFGDLTTTGNRVRVTSGSNATVNFGTTLADAGLLANGATLWFSFIVQTDAASSTNDQGGFALGTGALGTGNNIPMSSGNSGVGIAYFRGTRLNAASWNNAISQTGPNSGLATNTPTLLVAKIEWGADDEAAETVTIYKPNTALELPATAHAVHTAPALNQASFTSIAFTRKGDAGKVDFYDEIRFGATYEDVIGLGGNDPEPGPVASFDISPIASPQTVGEPITGIDLTAKDAEGEVATGFTGTVTFGGTGGFSGTSATFTAGVLNGVSVTPTASGSNLTFTVADGAGSTGTATIATINPAQSPYDTWADGALFAGDANGDGIANGMAWLLGAANPAADALALLPTGAEESGSLVIRFRMRNTANRGDAVLQLQHSSDLGAADAWASIVVPEISSTVDNVAFVITADGDINDVVASIPLGESAAGKLFARLLGEP